MHKHQNEHGQLWKQTPIGSQIQFKAASPGALSNVITVEHEVILCAIGFKSTQAILHYCCNKLELLFILNSSAGWVKKRRKTLRPEELEFQDHLLKRVNSLQFNINQTEMTKLVSFHSNFAYYNCHDMSNTEAPIIMTKITYKYIYAFKFPSAACQPPKQNNFSISKLQVMYTNLRTTYLSWLSTFLQVLSNCCS